MSEVATRKMTPEQVFRQEISSPASKAQIEAALPKQVPLDRFLRMTMTAVGQQPDLLKADRASLYVALLQAASLGLMPESFLGECYFVVRGGKVGLQIGYKGLMKLARNTGEIASVAAGVIYENDEFEYTEGDNSTFWARPNLRGDRGAPLAAWCTITLKGGEIQREVMPAFEIEQIRKASASANSPAWKNHWGQMARKVVIKRAMKYAPSSTEVIKAIAIDDAPDSGATIALVPDAGGGSTEVQVIQAPKDAAPKGARKASAKGLAELEAHLTQHVEPDTNEPPPSFHDQAAAEEAQFHDHTDDDDIPTGLAG